MARALSHMTRCQAIAVTLLLGSLITPPAHACTGDLDGDGAVRIDEAIALIGCALAPTGDCTPMPVHELVACVGNALYGCDLDPVWMTKIPCMQCGDCELTINELLELLAGGTVMLPLDVPEGVTVLDVEIEIAGPVVCLACSCPAAGTPIHRVLVPRRDVAVLLEHGWYAQG